MIDPALIEQLKSANYPFRKMDIDPYRIPTVCYREPTVGDMLYELGDSFEKLVKYEIMWEAFARNGIKGTGKKPLEALIVLYIGLNAPMEKTNG